jgi:osmoprotectant transport system permease protein
MLVGLQNVPEDVRESARGMGYGRNRLLWKVELPVALPTIMAGVRVATVSTVALVTVGVLVGEGGLGQLILRGFNNNFYRAEILTASVLTVALGLTFDLLLAGATRLMTPWSRRRT